MMSCVASTLGVKSRAPLYRFLFLGVDRKVSSAGDLEDASLSVGSEGTLLAPLCASVCTTGDGMEGELTVALLLGEMEDSSA